MHKLSVIHQIVIKFLTTMFTINIWFYFLCSRPMLELFKLIQEKFCCSHEFAFIATKLILNYLLLFIICAQFIFSQAFVAASVNFFPLITDFIFQLLMLSYEKIRCSLKVTFIAVKLPMIRMFLNIVFTILFWHSKLHFSHLNL